jgi:NAD-dependent dihydropyrimidine dehydrogenase PreA subunit
MMDYNKSSICKFNFSKEEERVFIVTVDTSKCDGCEECVNLCPSEVFRLTDGKSDPYKADDCVNCQTCVEGCPQGAITVTEM